MKARRVLLIGVSALLVVAASGCDWLQPGFNAGHSNYNPVEPALTTRSVSTLASKFSIAATGRRYGQPIVAGQHLYTTSFESTTGTTRLEQFDAGTGHAGWSTTLATGVAAVTDPAAGSGSVYAVTFDSRTGATTLFDVSASTGAVAWHVALPTSGQVPGPVRVDHGKVLVLLWQPGTFYGPWGTVKVVALDATTGAADWTFSATDSVVSTMDTAVERGRVVVTYLCCARPGHPEGVWTTAFLNENDGSLPVGGVSNNELLTTAAEGFLYGQQVDTTFGSVSIVAIDQATGSTWTQPFGGTAAVSSTSAIFTSPSGLRAFDPRTGAAQWTSSPLTGRFSEPVIAGGVAYLVTVDSTSAKLHTFDAATGAEVNSLTIPGPDPFGARAPVVANGRVYVNETGSITAYAP